MNFLFGPALGLIFSSTNLWSLNFTVFDQRLSADINRLLESNLLILDEAAFSEVLLALFLLL